MKWYSYKNILSVGATYNMIVGERSNGKTFGALKMAIDLYVDTGRQSALIRRLRESLVGKEALQYMQSMIDDGNGNNYVKKKTKGQWDCIFFKQMQWFFGKYDEKGKKIYDKEPFCYAFALSTSMETGKGPSYPHVDIIIFDEFLTRGRYLPLEFTIFQNVISTIVRKRPGVKIFMLANTVNKSSPYFKNMGITRFKDQKQGTIDVYMMKDNSGKEIPQIAVEYCESTKTTNSSINSDIYFAFDNPAAKMITDGTWETDVYPKLPEKYEKNEVKFNFFIEFEGDVVHGEIIKKGKSMFAFLHKKTTPIRTAKKIRIYDLDPNIDASYRTRITRTTDKIDQLIYGLLKSDLFFYQDNETGEIVRNYLANC